MLGSVCQAKKGKLVSVRLLLDVLDVGFFQYLHSPLPYPFGVRACMLAFSVVLTHAPNRDWLKSTSNGLADAQPSLYGASWISQVVIHPGWGSASVDVNLNLKEATGIRCKERCLSESINRRLALPLPAPRTCWLSGCAGDNHTNPSQPGAVSQLRLAQPFRHCGTFLPVTVGQFCKGRSCGTRRGLFHVWTPQTVNASLTTHLCVCGKWWKSCRFQTLLLLRLRLEMCLFSRLSACGMFCHWHTAGLGLLYKPMLPLDCGDPQRHAWKVQEPFQA